MYLHQSSGSYWAGTGDSRHHVTIDLDDPTQRRQTTLNLGDP